MKVGDLVICTIDNAIGLICASDGVRYWILWSDGETSWTFSSWLEVVE